MGDVENYITIKTIQIETLKIGKDGFSARKQCLALASNNGINRPTDTSKAEDGFARVPGNVRLPRLLKQNSLVISSTHTLIKLKINILLYILKLLFTILNY